MKIIETKQGAVTVLKPTGPLTQADATEFKNTAMKVKNDPRVQEKAHQAADVAREKAPVVKDKVSGAASSAADKVTPSEGGAHLEDLHPDSTARQDNPYPQGDLP